MSQIYLLYAICFVYLYDHGGVYDGDSFMQLLKVDNMSRRSRDIFSHLETLFIGLEAKRVRIRLEKISNRFLRLIACRSGTRACRW